MKKQLLLLVIGLLFFSINIPVAAQGNTPIKDWAVQYTYGEQVLFRARVETPSPIKEASIFFRSKGGDSTTVVPATLDADGWLVYQHQLSRAALRPFAPVEFWYQLTLEDGETLTTNQLTFDYIDNRFPWQVLQDEKLRIHWYAGDLAFGQLASDAAHVSLQNIQMLLAVELTSPVDIYIYASSPDLRSALDLGNSPMVAGQASLDLGAAFVTIAPGAEQGLEIDRQIPHELAHLLTYQKMGNRYLYLPVWLREGIASVSERAPSSDYPVVLSQAVEKGAIIPMSQLCDSFPPDMSSTFQAYAQSYSFTGYIVDQYGPAGLVALSGAYGDGLGCEQGIEKTLGVSMEELETRWRHESLNEDPFLTASENLTPYFVLFLVVLVAPIWNAFSISAVKK